MAYFQKKSSNKFKAVKQEYNGSWFHSKGEAAYCQELDWRIKAGEIKSYERQVKIELNVNGVHITNYYIDFLVVDKYDSIQLIEYKGFKTNDWIIKWRLLQALINDIEPGAELILVEHKSTWKSGKKL